MAYCDWIKDKGYAGAAATDAWRSATKVVFETVEGELLGSGNGEPRQPLFFVRPPVLPGEVVEVRELAGPRARVEYPILLDTLRAEGVREEEVRVVGDARTREVREVWVPWQGRPSLAFSGPHDRHYTIERTRGRLLFGDGVHGRLLPAGADNVRARRYRSGGGADGNLPAGAIRQLLSGGVVAGVGSPRAAEGGADAEASAAVLTRGPLTLRHRRQAITLADFEALAREASPAVAVARATAAGGTVTVVVLPRGTEQQPQPSWQLRREVRDFLRARSPASLSGAVRVVAPRYLEVSVEARVAPAAGADAGVLAAAVAARLREFLHPLRGGPEREGWPFGRGVHLSDLAAVLEAADGIDYVESLALLVDGAPQGDAIVVPGDRVVAAGSVEVALGGVS